MFRRDFNNFELAYWIQGALEISGIEIFSNNHIAAIKRRLYDIEGFDVALNNLLEDITEDNLVYKTATSIPLVSEELALSFY